MTRGQLDHAGVRILWLRLRRPRLAAGVAGGILAYVLLLLLGDAPGRIRIILAWDIGVLLAMILLAGLRNTSPETMKRIADRQDAGKWAVLLLTLLAATASLITIAGEVPFVRNATDLEKLWRIALIVVTIILSWTFIHTIFTLHYAHDYYSTSPVAAGKPRKGLAFPGEAMPTYMDFAYFSFTIGMTFQVSDVQVTDADMRKLALTHGIISFFYATGILALTINMVASLI
ncbi:MAG TPA: DUF1345 domain-containing protein [Burkholderiales bacterium]|nr:DUF1345 domain-containing protein [Burkholderiales bacterium]